MVICEGKGNDRALLSWNTQKCKFSSKYGRATTGMTNTRPAFNISLILAI